MQLPSGKTCQAERFSRRNRQALRGWGLSNASARWRNFLGAIASCRIVKCSRQAAKLAGRRSSLLLLPNHAGAPNAADRRQNLPSGEVLSCYCQTMRERQMQPTGGKTCQAAKFFRRNCQVLRDWGLSNAADRRQTCQVKKFPYLPRWQPAVACVHAFPCLQGCFLVLRAVSSLRQSVDFAKILRRSASVSVKAALCPGKAGCMTGFLVRQLGARRVARANFQKYTQIT